MYTGRETQTISERLKSTETTAISKDGQLAAFGHKDGQVVVREVETGNEIHTIKIFDNPVTIIDFSADNQKILVPFLAK